MDWSGLNWAFNPGLMGPHLASAMKFIWPVISAFIGVGLFLELLSGTVSIIMSIFLTMIGRR